MISGRGAVPLFAPAPLVLVAALLAGCGGGGGRDGGGRKGRPAVPVAAVVGAVVPSGAEALLTVSVSDPDSRPVDLLVEYSVDGGGTWVPATQLAGEAPLTDVPATPAGTEVSFTWLCFEDLGCGSFSAVRLRATPLDPAGEGGELPPFELITYRVLTAEELRSDLYPDLQADGRLDSFALLDTRDPGDHESGALPGARSVPLASILADGAAALPGPTDARIVFYCFGGG